MTMGETYRLKNNECSAAHLFDFFQRNDGPQLSDLVVRLRHTTQTTSAIISSIQTCRSKMPVNMCVFAQPF